MTEIIPNGKGSDVREDINNEFTKLELKVVDYSIIKNVTANYTLVTTDNGASIVVNSATAVTITVPDSLAIGFACSIRQLGAGQVTIAKATSGNMTINNFKGYTKTAGQYAVLSLQVIAANVAVIDGIGA